MNLEDYHAYRMAKNIRAAYPPILIIIGLAGNILSLIILAQIKHRRTSTGAMLILLTLTDSVILVFVLFVKWLNYVFEINVRSSSNFSCKVHVYFTYILLQFSPWILVIITCERICSVLYLDRVRRIFTRRNVLILSLLCAVSLACLNSHLLYGYKLIFVAAYNKTICQVTTKHKHFMFKVWPWIDFLFAFAIPFCVLICGNIIVLRKLKLSYHFRKSSFMILKAVTRSKRKLSKQEKMISKRVSYFTKVAIILSLAFAVFVSPFVFFAIGQPYWFPADSMTAQKFSEMTLIGNLMHMLMFTNNAINFVLYILCGSRFRADFLKFIHCKGYRFRSSSMKSSNRDRSTSYSLKSKRPSTTTGPEQASKETSEML